FSRHPSHRCLRRESKRLPLYPFRTLIRLGSTTEVNMSRYAVEINSIESIKNSSNKRLMKVCFDLAQAKTAAWIRVNTLEELVGQSATITEGWSSKLVAKSHYGSKGRGNTLIENEDQLVEWSRGKTISNYIFERYHNYG